MYSVFVALAPPVFVLAASDRVEAVNDDDDHEGREELAPSDVVALRRARRRSVQSCGRVPLPPMNSI
eukprot:9820261-Lingulodinium_polyedra.AAC.1